MMQFARWELFELTDLRFLNVRERSGSYQHSLVAASTAGSSDPSSAAGPSRTPYRPGFQPKGVSRSQTEAFYQARIGREERREGRRGEERRLGRRLEKLIALHFTPPSAAARAQKLRALEDAKGGGRTNELERVRGHKEGGSADRRESSLVEELLVEGKSPRDIWRSFKERSFSISQQDVGAGLDSQTKMTPEHKRGASRDCGWRVAGLTDPGRRTARAAVEQSIVKWEDDSDAKQCTICQCVGPQIDRLSASMLLTPFALASGLRSLS